MALENDLEKRANTGELRDTIFQLGTLSQRLPI